MRRGEGKVGKVGLTILLCVPTLQEDDGIGDSVSGYGLTAEFSRPQKRSDV